MTSRALATLLVPLFALTACQRAARLDTRTFKIEHLRPDEAASLIDPYVYGERAGAPGTFSTSSDAITVRETADNLDKIERVLAEFDVPRPDVRLRFQLIEADGFRDPDPRIADVVTQLRTIFQFRGYRLDGEAVVRAADASEIEQGIKGDEGVYRVQVRQVHHEGTNAVRLEGVRLLSPRGAIELTTTVTIRPGQTLVLGSAPRAGASATLLLTLTAEESG